MHSRFNVGLVQACSHRDACHRRSSDFHDDSERRLVRSKKKNVHTKYTVGDVHAVGRGQTQARALARGAGQGSSHTFVLDRMGVQVCACVCMSCVHLSHTDAGARTTSLTRGHAVEPTRPVRCVPVGHAWHARAHIRVWALAAPHAFARTRLHARMHTCARMCTHLPHMCTHVLCACATHVPRTCRAGAAHVHACARTHVHGRTHAHPGV